MKLKNLVLTTLIISLLGCGSDDSSSVATPVPPTLPLPPTEPVPPTPPVEKIYTFQDLYDVSSYADSGFAYVGATLAISPTQESLNSKLTLLEAPEGSSYQQSRIYVGYTLDLLFDKPGKYKFEYLNSSVPKYIEIEVKEGNLIEGQILTEDMVLSDTLKPYILKGNLGIPEGLTLKINKGATLITSNHRISVEGVIDATGDKLSPVQMYDAVISPVGNKGLIKIHHANLDGGSLYALLPNLGKGNLDLQDSIIKNQNDYSPFMPYGNMKIIRNHFINSSGMGFRFSDGQIEQVQVLNNKFEEWSTAIAIESIGSFDGLPTVDISYNSFITDDKRKFAVYVPDSYDSASTTLVMKNNYWGTTDVGKINDFIRDRNDDSASAGYVKFEPFLTKPDAFTPQ